jgi:hypothetical protein
MAFAAGSFVFDAVAGWPDMVAAAAPAISHTAHRAPEDKVCFIESSSDRFDTLRRFTEKV